MTMWFGQEIKHKIQKLIHLKLGSEFDIRFWHTTN
jgi:hypothetical protein